MQKLFQWVHILRNKQNLILLILGYNFQLIRVTFKSKLNQTFSRDVGKFTIFFSKIEK